MTLPINDMTLNRWIRRGVLDLPLCGTGHKRTYQKGELRAMVAVDGLRRLGGVAPDTSAWTPTVTDLARAVAEAARSNPPRTVVELPSPCSYVRHVLVVPDTP